MKYRVLLINPDAKSIEIESRELSSRGINVVTTRSVEEAIRLLREDGLIHVILTEWEVPVSSVEGELVRSVTLKGAELFEEFKVIRFEVNIFLFTKAADLPYFNTGGDLNGYFYKGDNDYDDIVRKIRTEVINSKNRAPFFEKLLEYARKSKDSWHTPGHASGYSVKNSIWTREFYEFFGANLFRSDVSVSVPMLDSLLHPTGVIKEAHELAARAFSSRYTFFSTNGTSTANKILLQTLLRPGEAILLDRNCHKSVHYGTILAGAEPIYLTPSVNNRYGIFGPVPKKRIFATMDKALAMGKKLKVMILTNCTYDGLVYDIADIVKEAHKRKIKVIVDEAWYGYARFHPHFYPCAMEAGADYSTQSTHKTMSAFSQASMIHVNDPEFEDIEEFFMENFNMHTSTSPQYPMIASLDVARKQMVMEGYSLLSRCIELSDTIKKSINTLSKFKVLELDDLLSEEVRNDGIRLDPTKLTIDVSGTGFSSKEVEHFLLEKHNIQIEKTTFNTLTVLITIGATHSKLNRLFLALENIEKMSGTRRPHKQISRNDFFLELSPMRYMPRFAFYCDGEYLTLRDAVGKISACMVTPYPPGIPLLVPGQIITRTSVEALNYYRDYNVEVHGLKEGRMNVLTDAEEAQLTADGYGIVDITESCD
ncbi:MAG TPA: aminotransferase class I/II-fold pyridoxal phosphate-dependent enzyme [Candidatus Rifleibacterium sp.]|nr:aminotransferase class I/II-fold pyridoxal phosphate-dependent enzyme [Candidatus Rifleibacterium sp.]HPT46991.1 aminotransferase class I/II-fold pyridoxal phosphate-dependent enzyme [Candidatus Rifleibacterium sp.]